MSLHLLMRGTAADFAAGEFFLEGLHYGAEAKIETAGYGTQRSRALSRKGLER